MAGTVRIEARGHLAILRLDKGRGNAIDEPLVDDLSAAAQQVAADGSVRGVLLASAHPKLFSPGLDLVTLIEYDRSAMARFMEKFAEAMLRLYQMPKPVVAAVGGHAVAGGCVLALTADYRVLRQGGVQIGLNEVRVGVPLPWSVAILLKATVPASALSQVALLGRNFADDEAVQVGLVDALADANDFEDFCLLRLEEFAEKDAAAFATIKAYLRADALREMKAHEAARLGDFLDGWFSESAQARIRTTIASLKK